MAFSEAEDYKPWGDIKGGRQAPQAPLRNEIIELNPPPAPARARISPWYGRGRGQGVGRLAPQANKIPPLRGASGRVSAKANKIPPQRALRGACPRWAIKSLRKGRSGILSCSDRPDWVNRLIKSRRAKPRGIFPARPATDWANFFWAGHCQMGRFVVS